ncbi:MAG: 2-oxoacid:ferredoxin oxidoreductase subunit beta [Candidatus Lokiarchaeota archaeon]|nr:2-oxoacid:ferredoxin oxidoreductase subunit beta [Candidatus Lokiarchaeota archaeon]MBD3340297.1 2-oxoacid:ferredoxin oxidoreductase subunit beta [Candidatus Lokiarchaeota archaeon]
MLPNEKPEHPYLEASYAGSLFGNFATRFCSGCGYGIVGQIYTRVFEDMKLDPKLYPLVVGIGCYSQIMLIVHQAAQKILTLHGRAPAIATGLKMANPKMKPIIFSGDGDCLGIGGNHFIHLCRRNLDAIVFIFNNSIYAMTGGQGAPTTLFGAKSTTTPYQMFENRSDGVKLALAAGATHVARTTVAHPRTYMKYFKKALNHKGTSVIEIITPCVTYFGRKNLSSLGSEAEEEEPQKMDTGGKMIDWIKKNTVRRNQAKFMTEEELFNKYVIGEFRYDDTKPEYSEEYAKIQQKAMEG